MSLTMLVYLGHPVIYHSFREVFAFANQLFQLGYISLQQSGLASPVDAKGSMVCRMAFRYLMQALGVCWW